MTPILSLALAMLLPAGLPTRETTAREPNPLAPSLPLLTDEEEEHYDRVIDRFIQADIGKLRGEEAKQALAEFQRLPPEATFALIRGLNRAALIEGSCPAVLIAKKLTFILSASNDPELLDFARENVGLGVGQSRHMVVIKDLRVTCALRKSAVVRTNVALRTTPSGPKAPAYMSIGELVQAAGSERGPRLRQVLTELERRKGQQVLVALGQAASNYDTDTQHLARDLLTRHLSRQSPSLLKEQLKDDRSEVRAAAARVVGLKGWRLGDDLIQMLNDDNEEVRQAARQSLVRLSGGADYGPARDAAEEDRDVAVRHWQEWWSRQSSR